jgi:hypothetical protein
MNQQPEKIKNIRNMMSTSPIHTSGPNKMAFAAKGGDVS